MTREEARELLQTTPIDIRSPREDLSFYDYFEALNMAIEALQERPKAQWLGVDSRYCKCTNCGILADFNLAEYYPVCPQCEAEMWNGRKKW